jgi:Fur family zinc uptake transcriptional regulator
MNLTETIPCIAFEHHDHRDCQHQLLAEAKALCAKRNTRLTRRRLQVLEILLRSHQPMGAYEIMAHLNQVQSKAAIAPPIVYRALEFLIDEGLAHRIESKNAYISCVRPGHQCAAQFLICSGCEKVAELENRDSGLLSDAARFGFTVDSSVVEITGHCADCGKNVS